jgi:hypothetical protein
VGAAVSCLSAYGAVRREKERERLREWLQEAGVKQERRQQVQPLANL